MQESLWEKLKLQFEFMSTSAGATENGDATPELLIMVAVSFILGFLFCYVQGKSRD